MGASVTGSNPDQSASYKRGIMKITEEIYVTGREIIKLLEEPNESINIGYEFEYNSNKYKVIGIEGFRNMETGKIMNMALNVRRL